MTLYAGYDRSLLTGQGAASDPRRSSIMSDAALPGGGETAHSYRLTTLPPIDIGEEMALVCGLPTAIRVKRSATINIPHDCASRPALSRDRTYLPRP